MKSFKEKVLAVVSRIPKGKVMTYKQVAQKAGNPKASRAVGTIVAQNFNPEVYCHRVVRSDGGLGGYNRGIPEKIRKLKAEGVTLVDDRVIL